MSVLINNNVVVFRNKESIVVRSIDKKLAEINCNPIVCGLEVHEIDRHIQDSMIFVVYIPDDLNENIIKGISYLCDVVNDGGRYFIGIGDAESHAKLSKEIPGFKKQIWMERPIDIDAFADKIELIMENIRDKAFKKRILIIDDDPTYAKTVRMWLKDTYKVYVVASGMQAITFLNKNEVDLILLDYEMPIVDGPQVLAMLREEPLTADIPVIFLTGVGTEQSVKRVMALKPKGYILKSTGKPSLLQTITSYFENNK